MRKYQFLAAFLLAVLLSSCTTKLELEKAISEAEPFQVTTFDTIRPAYYHLPTEDRIENRMTELGVNSSEWNEVFEWIMMNQSGWKLTEDFYRTDAIISQGALDLTCLYNSGFVVLKLTDEKGDIKQYMKEIDLNELSFLYNQKVDQQSRIAGSLISEPNLFDYEQNYPIPHRDMD